MLFSTKTTQPTKPLTERPLSVHDPIAHAAQEAFDIILKERSNTPNWRIGYAELFEEYYNCKVTVDKYGIDGIIEFPEEKHKMLFLLRFG